MNFPRIATVVVLALLALVHIAYNLCFAYASFLHQQDTESSLRRAIRFTPADPNLYSRLASLDPSHGIEWLDTALRLNPDNSVVWMERGVRAEIAGDTARAESSFIEAARRDHQYIPRWNLAAFYFRQQNAAQFSLWARQALEMAWGDALPLFQMASSLGMSLDQIRRDMLPPRAPVISAFVSECIRRKDAGETLRAARQLVEIGSKDVDRGVLLAAIDSLSAAGQPESAIELWNQGSAAHWYPHPAIGPLIPNSDFSFEFLPAGFDWRTSPPDGVVTWRLGNGRGLQFEFSGREPESCTLLYCSLPLRAGKPYKFLVKGEGFPTGSGLKWHLGSETWDALAPEHVATAPDKSPGLTLTYNRELGTRRIEGTLTLLHVEVVPAAEGAR